MPRSVSEALPLLPIYIHGNVLKTEYNYLDIFNFIVNDTAWYLNIFSKNILNWIRKEGSSKKNILPALFLSSQMASTTLHKVINDIIRRM
jgi:hypothetical protein